MPLGLAKLSVKGFANLYGISLSEAEKPLKDYICIGEFFSRRLLPHLRPVASQHCVHPVDAALLRVQAITEGEMYQAKGQTYSLSRLLEGGGSGHRDGSGSGSGSGHRSGSGSGSGSGEEDILSLWKGGLAFTYYLCPRDYHRIHCPFDAKVVKVLRLKGTLWPVHAWARKNVSQVFCRNERVLVFLESTENPYFQGVLVCIGALNVGSITLAFDHKKPALLPQLKKGQEVAAFRMGSSVVFLCNALLRNQFLLPFRGQDNDSLKALPEQQVRMGEFIGFC